MGKIKNASIGALRGKVGNLVGSTWKGTDYYRIHNEHIANPRTEKQLAQRAKFTGVATLAHKLRTPIIKPIWNNTAIKMSGTNSFMQKNIQAFNAKGEIEDYARLIISNGRLDAPSINTLKDPSDDGSYLITWTDNAELYDFDETDQLNILVFNETDKSFTPELHLKVATRKEMMYQFTPKGAKDDKIHIFTYFSKADGTNFTESKHFPMTIYK